LNIKSFDVQSILFFTLTVKLFFVSYFEIQTIFKFISAYIMITKGF